MKETFMKILFYMYLISILYILLIGIVVKGEILDIFTELGIVNPPTGDFLRDALNSIGGIFNLLIIPFNIPLPPIIDYIWKGIYIFSMVVVIVETVRGFIPFLR